MAAPKRAKTAARHFPVQGKLTEGKVPHRRGGEEVSGGEQLCAAHQDVWAPEVPGELMREVPARLPIRGHSCSGRRWACGGPSMGHKDGAKSVMWEVFHFCCLLFIFFLFYQKLQTCVIANRILNGPSYTLLHPSSTINSEPT